MGGLDIPTVAGTTGLSGVFSMVRSRNTSIGDDLERRKSRGGAVSCGLITKQDGIGHPNHRLEVGRVYRNTYSMDYDKRIPAFRLSQAITIKGRQLPALNQLGHSPGTQLPPLSSLNHQITLTHQIYWLIQHNGGL